MPKKDLFSDENVVRSQFWNPKNIGDSVAGYLVERKKVTQDSYGHWQRLYVLHQEDGTEITVAGRWNMKDEENTKETPRIIDKLEAVKLGQMCGVKFTAEKPPTKKGNHPTKVLQVYAIDEFKPELIKDTLNELFSESNAVDESKKDIPF